MDFLLFDHFRSLQANRAAAEGNLPVVQQLAVYSDNETLLVACRTGHVKVVDFLLAWCPHIDTEAGDLVHGRSPLGWACHKGHLEVVRLFIEKYKCSTETRNSEGSTALHLACAGGHLDVVRLLLQYSSDVECRDHIGATPLYLASDAGHVDIVQILLDDASASIDASDNYGWTPLFLSVMNAQRLPPVCDSRVLHVLLERGANVHAATFTGDTPLKRARATGLLDPLYGIIRTRPEEWEVLY